MVNFLLRTDSYKLTHWRQYPPDAEMVYSYLESRGGDYDETVFFGLQYYLKKYLEGSVITASMIDEAEALSEQHFGQNLFNRKGWEHILQVHEGRLPIEIYAVSEGTVVPTNNVLMTVQNTDPKVPWLTNYVESLLLKVWYPITVATLSREVKKTIKYFLNLTGDLSQLPFKLHDFGYRGVSSEESACIGGAAHLVNFKGTDTLMALNLLKDYYAPETLSGFSVPASEHSTMTSWGQDYEADAFSNMLEQYPTGLVSVVSDSYDIFNACEHLWGEELHDRVLARDGILVIRPDSGDPASTILRLLDILKAKFGATENAKHFLELNPKVRLIQGDGVNPASISRILDTMRWRGWSANNIVFGMGGGLLQQVNRDTQRFAFKCSAVLRGGQWQDVYKTATGKESKRGKLVLLRRPEAQRMFEIGMIDKEPTEDYITRSTMVKSVHEGMSYDISNYNELKLRFRNGQIHNALPLEEIRLRAEVK